MAECFCAERGRAIRAGAKAALAGDGDEFKRQARRLARTVRLDLALIRYRLKQRRRLAPGQR